MPGGACGQFEFEFGFEFNLVHVFAPKIASHMLAAGMGLKFGFGFGFKPANLKLGVLWS